MARREARQSEDKGRGRARRRIPGPLAACYQDRERVRRIDLYRSMVRPDSQRLELFIAPALTNGAVF